MIPIYSMTLREETEGMDFMALVDNPAHRKAFEYFNGEDKKKIKQHFNEEQRVVTGVAIAVDLPIYRNDSEIGEHYVVFSKKEASKIAQRMFKNGYANNVNEMHDSNKTIKGITLFESYFVDNKRGVVAPESFKSQNLKDGSWIVSYKVENEEVWNGIKNGKHVGFSIEGWFNKENIKLKQTKMAKKEKGKFWDVLFGNKSKFGEATTVDGLAIKWEGELAEGVELMMVTEEGEMLAPEGVHSVEVDGVVTAITVDGNGIVVSIEEGTEEEEVDEEMSETQKALIEIKRLMDEGFASAKQSRKESEEAFNTKLENLAVELDKDNKKKFNKNTAVKNWKNLK